MVISLHNWLYGYNEQLVQAKQSRICKAHKIHQMLSLAFMAMAEVVEEEEVVVAAVEVGLSLLERKRKRHMPGQT